MSLRRSLFVSFILGLTLIAQPSSVDGFQQPAEDLLTRIVPEQCIFFGQWMGIGELDPSRNPTEQWLAQDEIQLTFKHLFSAIEEYQQLHPVDNPVVHELLVKLPSLVRDCPASFYLEAVDPKTGFENSASMGALIKLNGHEAWANDMLEKLLASDEGKEIERVEHQGTPAFKLIVSKRPVEFSVHFAVIKGHILVTAGIDAFEKAVANLKTPEPKWIGDLEQQLETGRTIARFHFDPTTLLEMNNQLDERDRIPAFLGMDNFKSIGASMGMDSDGFVTSILIRCAEKPNGILSVIGTEPIKDNYIDELPGDAMTTAAFRLVPRNLFALVDEIMVAEGESDSLVEFVDTVESISGLNFETEILDSFDGFVSSYQSLSPLSGGTAGVFSLRIKDPEEFSRRLAKFNRSVAVEAEAVGLGRITEKQSQGQTIITLERPAYMGPSLSWCHVENQLYIAVDSKSISAHLRKRGREGGRLVDDAWFKKMFDYGKSKQWGNPIACSTVDIVTLMEFTVPLAQTFLAGREIPDFYFTIEDIPPVEVLTNGVQENVTVVFRTKEGFRFIERSTLPGTTSVAGTGIMIGMLLPAVQQARNAARRAVNMNNMRQLQLGVLNYESTHGHLPPAYSTDKNGKPLLSWRVLILPYLEQQGLYDQFHLDEPWDSEHNLKLVQLMPETFENPGLASPTTGRTTFLGVSGKNGVFGAPPGIKFAHITDGSSQTISIVDVNRDHTVVWTSPQDFDPAEQKDLLDALSGTWPSGFMVNMCDGSAHVFDEDEFDEEQLRNLLDRRDSKPVELNR